MRPFRRTTFSNDKSEEDTSPKRTLGKGPTVLTPENNSNRKNGVGRYSDLSPSRRITAAGTVPDSHRIPFSPCSMHGTESVAKVNNFSEQTTHLQIVRTETQYSILSSFSVHWSNARRASSSSIRQDCKRRLSAGKANSS